MITEGVRKYAAEQGFAKEEALMETKWKEFVEKGAAVYAKV